MNKDVTKEGLPSRNKYLFFSMPQKDESNILKKTKQEPDLVKVSESQTSRLLWTTRRIYPLDLHRQRGHGGKWSHKACTSFRTDQTSSIPVLGGNWDENFFSFVVCFVSSLVDYGKALISAKYNFRNARVARDTEDTQHAARVSHVLRTEIRVYSKSTCLTELAVWYT